MDKEERKKEQFYRAVGVRIRQERKALGFTQADVAAFLGLSRPAINAIELGQQQLRTHQLYEIACALGVPLMALLPEQEREVENA